MFSKEKVTEIFCIVDDFAREFESRIRDLKLAQLATDKQHRNRPLSGKFGVTDHLNTV